MGHVSPQFHVVFLKKFSTDPHIREGTVPSNWTELVWHSSELATPDFFLESTFKQHDTDEVDGRNIQKQHKPDNVQISDNPGKLIIAPVPDPPPSALRKVYTIINMKVKTKTKDEATKGADSKEVVEK